MTDSRAHSTASLQEGIAALVDAHRELTTLLEDLKSELATSLGQWDDNARNSYAIAQSQWNASAKRQQDIVQRMPVLLGNIADGYNATEVKNAGIWGK